MFKFWSDTKKEAKDELRPDLGFRSWNDLEHDDKKKIWSYLWESWFFNSNRNDLDAFYSDKQFSSDRENEKGEKLKRIATVLDILNYKYKANTYARSFLDDRGIHTAIQDFYGIYIDKSENVVFELLSIYANGLTIGRENVLSQKEGELKEEFEKRSEEYVWKEFDEFSDNLNDLFDHFGIYVFLARQGFILRQDEKIVKEIYEPVLNYLSDRKWKEVNDILLDAFSDYRKNTPQGYSSCVTNTISAIQAFLQILVNGKIGSSEGINELINKATEKKLIPDDKFSKQIFKNIESILMRERGKPVIEHPKKEYANEKNARLVLNLLMIFFQHCIQNE